MRQTFILYNDTQLNVLLKAKKLDLISIVDARYYERKDTNELLFNVVSVKGSKITIRVLEKVISVFDPKKIVSCEALLNKDLVITDMKNL